MANVLFVKPNEKNTRYKIGVDYDQDAATYSVSAAVYSGIGAPKRGAELTYSELLEIRRDDEIYRATKKAYSCIAYSDRSKYALRMKLRSLGFSAEASALAIERCEQLGYLDENRQLLRAVEREANYGLRGKYYIKRKLAGKGYSLSGIDDALRTLTESGEVDFDANFERLAQKRGALSDKDRLALKYRFGYKI